MGFFDKFMQLDSQEYIFYLVIAAILKFRDQIEQMGKAEDDTALNIFLNRQIVIFENQEEIDQLIDS